MKKLANAKERIWLASPFITLNVAKEISNGVRRSPVSDKRLLTAVSDRSVEVGVLDPTALDCLADAGFKIVTFDNLHAKISLVDAGWGLLGSGNLTGSGLGSEDGGGNHELGVILARKQTEEASDYFAGWWKSGRKVRAAEIKKLKQLPRLPREKRKRRQHPLPVADVVELKRFLAGGFKGSENFWIDANYRDRANETWWQRGWISGQPEVCYARDDLIVIYLGSKYGGPKKCPAIVQATTATKPDPDWVAANRDDPEAPKRWPNVTWIRVLGEVTPTHGVALELIKRTGQSVQRGFLPVTRAEFEVLAQAMIESS